MTLVKHNKVVSSLPSTLQADSIYYVRVGTGFDIYVTNSSGTIIAYPLNASINIPVIKRQTVILPLIGIGSTDIIFNWNNAFSIIPGLTEQQTLDRISVVPSSSPNGLSVGLLGKIAVNLKSKTLTGGTLTITNTGLLSLSANSTLDIIGFLET